MSSPRKEAKKDDEEKLEDKKENPTDIGPGITEEYKEA
jgi:hypothetical protein